MEVEEIITDSIKKPIPDIKKSNCSPLSFEYNPSKDGIDSNLLILLHGYGDTEKPFFSLGKKLQGDLPQTSILSLRGCDQVPFMDVGTSFGFWNVWNEFGEEIQNPNPTKFLQLFQNLIEYLIRPIDQNGCGWPSNSIHLLGYTQGATAAMEGVIAYTRKQIDTSTSEYVNELGSIVNICGDLLSFPTFSSSLKIPALIITRDQNDSTIKTIKKAFRNTEHLTFSTPSNQPSMPKNEHEWRKIMEFWSKVWRNRTKWELEGDLYTVKTTIQKQRSKSNPSVPETGQRILDVGWSPTAEEKMKK